MKYIVRFIVVTLLILSSTTAFAEQKIVILDLKYVLNQSKAGKGAQEYLKKSFETNGKKFAKIEQNLKKEETDLLSKKTVLSKEEYNKKTDTLRKKVIDYQSQKRLAFERIATQRAEARENLLKQIDPILNTYIKDNSISIIIDKNYTVGGTGNHDITKNIIELLNKELPSLNLN
tara:strand:- start:3000 stop:3524 length:525 start_codon:yes stop_codon:yes gene_type:complete